MPACGSCKITQKNGCWGRGGYVGTAWIGTQFAGCDSCAIKKRIGHSAMLKPLMVRTRILNYGGLDVQSLINRV